MMPPQPLPGDPLHLDPLPPLAGAVAVAPSSSRTLHGRYRAHKPIALTTTCAILPGSASILPAASRRSREDIPKRTELGIAPKAKSRRPGLCRVFFYLTAGLVLPQQTRSLVSVVLECLRRVVFTLYP